MRTLPLLFLLLLAFSPPARAEETPREVPAAPAGTSPVAVSAGFGRGVQASTADGQLDLSLRGVLQVRFLSLDPVDGGPPTTGLFVRRARVILAGRLLPELDFKLQLGFSGDDVDAGSLLDGFATWTRLSNLNVRVGQDKVPFSRQLLNSSSALQLVDRSIVTSELSLDRDAGVQVRSDDLLGLGKRLNYALGVFGGDGRNRVLDRSGLLLVARVGVKPLGDFSDLVESDLARSPSPRLALGLAAGRNFGARRERSTTGRTLELGAFDFWHAAADGIFKWQGLSVSGGFLYRRADSPVLELDGRRELARSAFGVYGQAGFVFLPNLEVAGRYGVIRPIGPGTSAVIPRQEVVGGLGWYLRGEALKLQADYSWLPVEDSALSTHQVRAQLQVAF